MDVRLLLIDAQNDFCDPNNGALFVPGADDDMRRVADMIKRLGKKLNRIHATLDEHHNIAIFHPIFWKNSKGDQPAPFTIITADDIKNSVWMTTHPGLQQYALNYAETLENGKRYPLCIWPVHCLIAQWGSLIFPPVVQAFNEWEIKYFKMVEYVSKGSNYRTEHYSAVMAEVPDPEDPINTNLNQGLIKTLEEADMIALAGEAKSHCLANTVRDIANNFSDDQYIKKLYLLKDATSNVPTFEKMGDDFEKEMVSRGMNITTTADFLA